MATAMSPAAGLDYRLQTFGERLEFARIFIAKVKSGRKMAIRLGFSPSTYATWENGTVPGNLWEIANRVHEVFPEIDLVWLLQGGVAIWSYLTSVEMPEGQMELAYSPRAHVA